MPPAARPSEVGIALRRVTLAPLRAAATAAASPAGPPPTTTTSLRATTTSLRATTGASAAGRMTAAHIGQKLGGVTTHSDTDVTSPGFWYQWGMVEL